jgi:lysophospholipase L1-like esterase
VAPLALTCPGDVSIPDVTTPTQPVQWSPPISAGGLGPVTATCAPASGAAFPVGATTVACTATDSSTPARTAACGFKVTLAPYVPPIPVLGATRFMAFGDSITAGEINDDDTGKRCTNHRALRTPEELALFLKPAEILPNLAYPHLVQGLLTARYTSQTFTVQNEGQSLDATDDTDRFFNVIQADRPEAVLFLQGIIDLSSDSAIPAIVANIDKDIATARSNGVASFFLSTLTPVEDFSRGCFASNADIQAANGALRTLAVQDNVVLVDSWAAFQGHESTYLGGDGLHPSVEGQQVLAKTFFDAIRAKLEAPSGATAAAGRGAASTFPGAQIQVRPKSGRQPIGIRDR